MEERMTDTAISTDVILDLRVSYGVLRQYDPTTFDYPPVYAEQVGPGMWEVAADIRPGTTVGLSIDPDADYFDVLRAVDRFNQDRTASWRKLLERMFTDARRTLADRRSELDLDDVELLNFEAGLLR
jgi:hypothetical protein